MSTATPTLAASVGPHGLPPDECSAEALRPARLPLFPSPALSGLLVSLARQQYPMAGGARIEWSDGRVDFYPDVMRAEWHAEDFGAVHEAVIYDAEGYVLGRIVESVATELARAAGVESVDWVQP